MDRVSELLLKQEERTSSGHGALWKGKCLTNNLVPTVASVCSLPADLQSDNSYTVLNGFHPPALTNGVDMTAQAELTGGRAKKLKFDGVTAKLAMPPQHLPLNGQQRRRPVPTA